MFTLGQEHIMEEASKPQPVMFTAGAVPIINKKGEVSMEKVHVKRYIAGKKPDWASEEESSDDEDQFKRPGVIDNEEAGDRHQMVDDSDMKNTDDSRLRRLRHHDHTDVEERIRRRQAQAPEVIAAMGGASSDEQEQSDEKEYERPERYSSKAVVPEEESSDEGELDDDEVERRRLLQRQRARAKVNEDEELLAIPDATDEFAKVKTKKDEEEDEYFSTDDSDYTDSEDEDEGQRLKPVFVRKKDRLTIQQREMEEERQRELEGEKLKAAEERKKYTIKMIEADTRAEIDALSVQDTESAISKALLSINSDDENEEAEYESWKLRELKRVKRDREEREARQKERDEVEALANMTAEERHSALRNNPRKVTNEKVKGKHKFMQKYYHRGAFFMEKDEDIYSRDFAAPTLDDHFDKTVLPKVMQVKNFGRSGRTKYTHLVDQDTTNFESPWSLDSSSTNKFMSNRGGGMKQVFDRPSTKKPRQQNGGN